MKFKSPPKYYYYNIEGIKITSSKQVPTKGEKGEEGGEGGDGEGGGGEAWKRVWTDLNGLKRVSTGSNVFQQVWTDCGVFQWVPLNRDTPRMIVDVSLKIFFVKNDIKKRHSKSKLTIY